jgi:hypothetical protein
MVNLPDDRPIAPVRNAEQIHAINELAKLKVAGGNAARLAFMQEILKQKEFIEYKKAFVHSVQKERCKLEKDGVIKLFVVSAKKEGK